MMPSPSVPSSTSSFSCSFGNVTYAPNPDIPASVRTTQHHPVRGYIMTRNIDPFGRPLSLAFRGAINRPDGSALSETLSSMNIGAEWEKMDRVIQIYWEGS